MAAWCRLWVQVVDEATAAEPRVRRHGLARALAALLVQVTLTPAERAELRREASGAREALAQLRRVAALSPDPGDAGRLEGTPDEDPVPPWSWP